MDMLVSIENFKSIKATKLPLRTGVTVLVGPNGSGKTCILSGLQFLADVLRLGAAHAVACSGGPNRVYRRGQKQMRFGVVCDYGERTYMGKKRPFRMSWKIQIAQCGAEEVATVTQEHFLLFVDVDGKSQIALEVLIGRKHPQRGSRSVSFNTPERFRRDLFQGRDSDFRRLSDMRTRVQPLVGRWMDGIKNNGDASMLHLLGRLDNRIWDFVDRLISLEEYSIIPGIARTPTDQLQFARMGTNGAAVSEVIYALENQHFQKIVRPDYDYMPSEYPYDKGPSSMFWRHRTLIYYRRRQEYWRWHRLDRVLSLINVELARAVQPIEGVGAEVDPSTGRRRLVFRSRGERFHAEEVSDGTMKWICILVSILVGDAPIYVLEEPENFLHPWMQQRLVEIMREETGRTRRSFLLSSHSATMLNAMMPSEVLVVTQSRDGTQIRGIADRTEIAKALTESNFGLGDLWVSGGIGGVPVDE